MIKYYMRRLSPTIIALLGPLLVGTAMAVGAYMAIPGFPEGRNVIFNFLVGTGAGLAVFGPISAFLYIKGHSPHWLQRNYFRFDFYVSIAMSLGLGYLLACIPHAILDAGTGFSGLIMLLGSVVKVSLHLLRREESDSGKDRSDKQQSNV